MTIDDLKCCGNCDNYYYGQYQSYCAMSEEEKDPDNYCHNWKYDNLLFGER